MEEAGIIKREVLICKIVESLEKANSFLIPEIIDGHYNKPISLDKFIFGEYIHRYKSKIKSLSVLLKLYIEDRYVETEIGMILRSGLLDSIMILYLIEPKIFQPNEQLFEERFGKFLCDQIDSSLRYYLKQVKSNIISEPDLKRFVDPILKKYYYLFNPNEIDYDNPMNNLKFKNGISISSVSKELIDSPDNRIKRYSRDTNLIDLYSYYSKYEHFGILTPELQRVKNIIEINRIIESIEYCFFSLNLALNEFYINNNEINSVVCKLYGIKEELEKLRIDFTSIK